MGGWLAKNARSGVGRGRVEGDAAEGDPDVLDRRHRAQRVLLSPAASTGASRTSRSCAARCTPKCGCRGRSAQPYPIILFHGNGQTGVQTGSRRRTVAQAGRITSSSRATSSTWSTIPARGRSAYVPLPGPDGKTPIDGNLDIRTALELERIWTNARERGDFPLKMNHTQWPGTGKIGDPIFDNFMQSQVQSAGASPALARDADVALLDRIGSAGDPVDAFAGRRHRLRGHRGASAVGESDGEPRARRSSVRQRRHCEGDSGATQSEFVGIDEHALRVRSAGERSQPI